MPKPLGPPTGTWHPGNSPLKPFWCENQGRIPSPCPCFREKTLLRSTQPAGLWPPPQVHRRQCPSSSRLPPFCSSQRFTPASCLLHPDAVLPATSAYRAPTCKPDPEWAPARSSCHCPAKFPAPATKLTRADSSTCPRRTTCSHSCWAWARPDFHATACLPTTTHICLDQEPFPVLCLADSNKVPGKRGFCPLELKSS